MDFSKIEESFAYWLGKVTFSMKSSIKREFKTRGYNATPEHLGILALLWRQEGFTQTEIADNTIKDKTNITRILDVMERNGLIIRKKDDCDRRVYKIYLTAQGKKIRDKLMPIADDVVQRATKGLTEKELKELMRILKIIYTNLE